MKALGIDFIAYNVSDLKKSFAFYKDTLGLTPFGDMGESWAEFEVGNVAFDLVSFDKEAAGKCSGLALAVPDVKAALEELRGKGVTVVQEFYETPVCTGAGIADPDGNQIYLHKRKDGTVG
ncbi:MAG: Glyoxalase/bleomycin resistance protein/dioxygenase [Candidatus Parcubacteria bacterium]|nr:Glyoxalase/bleomycin resistance protein/dioxygenase [Candidatus Parcubacteria bacterium]